MRKIFSFYKSDKSHFEKKEEHIEQIKIPDKSNELVVSLYDEDQTGYDDLRWINKSNSIKARDNYTCQLCHAFNSMQGGPVFIQQGKYKTFHLYTRNINSCYVIHVDDYNFDINFEFYNGFHLAMPRLNVHHKLYYRNRDIWDYPEDCLVTLCEDCHHYIHSLNDICIPIVEENSLKRNIGKMKPKSYLPKLDHTDLGTFQPLSLVKQNRWGIGLKGQDVFDFKRAKIENKKWYDYQEILDNHVVHISVLYMRHFPYDDMTVNKHTQEDIKEIADFIIHDFIENILGFSKKQKEND